MSDWLKKLFNEPQTLGLILTSGIVGLCVGIAQGTIQKRHGGWGGFFTSVVTAAVVAVIAGLALNDFIPSETARLAIIGVCAVVSEDIWCGIKTLGLGMRADPLGFIVRVLDALRGREPSARAMTSTPLAPERPPAPAVATTDQAATESPVALDSSGDVK